LKISSSTNATLSFTGCTVTGGVHRTVPVCASSTVLVRPDRTTTKSAVAAET
jgi:hypothetical protein